MCQFGPVHAPSVLLGTVNISCGTPTCREALNLLSPPGAHPGPEQPELSNRELAQVTDPAVKQQQQLLSSAGRSCRLQQHRQQPGPQ